MHKLIAKRLEESQIASSPETFFPVNETFEKELEQCRGIVRDRARDFIQMAPKRR